PRQDRLPRQRHDRALNAQERVGREDRWHLRNPRESSARGAYRRIRRHQLDAHRAKRTVHADTNISSARLGRDRENGTGLAIQEADDQGRHRPAQTTAVNVSAAAVVAAPVASLLAVASLSIGAQTRGTRAPAPQDFSGVWTYATMTPLE